jgi:hypothetical protein
VVWRLLRRCCSFTPVALQSQEKVTGERIPSSIRRRSAVNTTLRVVTMRPCKKCDNTVSLTTVRCERCGRGLPGFSHRSLRRAMVRGGMALAAIGVMGAFALAS